METYNSVAAFRSSDYSYLHRSPKVLRYHRDNPKEPTDAMIQGSLLHDAMADLEKFFDTHAREPDADMRTKVGKELVAEFRATLSPGMKPVKAKWFDILSGQVKSISEHDLVKRMIRGGERENSLFVTDPETGITLKCRPDIINADGFLIDFKTTRSLDPFHLSWSVYTQDKGGWFYARQGAHYVHCLRVAGISKREGMHFVFIEKEPPYDIQVISLGAGELAGGESSRRSLTALYAKCSRENHWPGKEQKALTPEIPQWATYVPEELENP